MLERLQQFYERRADDYPDVDRTAEVRYEKALRAANLQAGHRMLDIGCKDARLYGMASQRASGLAYTGVDISERNIAGCRQRFPDQSFFTGPIEGLDAGGPFDRIFMLEVLEHLRNPGVVIEHLRGLLAPKGELLVSVPNPYYYMEVVNELRGFPDTEGHLCSFTDANLRALLELNDLSVEDVSGTYILIPKQLRGAFRSENYWIVEWAPRFLACSRIYRCTLRTAAG